MTRTFLNLLLLSLITTLIGCASATSGTGTKKESEPFVSESISDSSREQVDQAIRDVFEADGFTFISERNDTLLFSKRGDNTTALLYGSTWSTDFMTIEPKIKVEDVGFGNFKLSCDVTIVEHTTKERTAGSRHQLIRRGKKAYQEMLKQVKAQAEK